MICQRSGYCCVWAGVVIGHEGRMKFKPAGVVCPNLSIDKTTGITTCKVHNEPWYKNTPCYAHGNPEVDMDYAMNPTKPCMIGVAIHQQKRDILTNTENIPLEDIGPLKW